MDIILNNANFRKLWFSSTFAGAASNIIQYALSLYVLDKTGSATAFASILSIIIFPRLLFSPIAGVWGDRVNRQKGLVYTTLMTVITLVIFGLGTYVASSLSLVAIYVLVIILELVEVFQSGPMMSVLPAIVEESQLALANTWMQVDNGIVNIMTPFVAAFIYSTFSITGSLFISGSILFFTMMGYAFMKIPERKVQQQMDNEQSVVNSFWADFKEGIQIAFEIPNLMIVVLLALFINFLMSPIFGIVITYFIRVTLQFTNEEFSMFQSFVAVVSMISPLIAYRLITESKEPVHLLLKYTVGFVVGLFVVMCGTMARDIFSMNQWMAIASILVGFIVVSILATYINIQLSTISEKIIPEQFLGRIGTTLGMLSTISVPIGQLVFGIILDYFNATVCLVVSIVGLVVFLIIANRMYHDSSKEAKNAI
ncbi:MFS transporter [Granulicatella elegans]|uniref:MFS transporter n=1 Tax=Granulicatella elegans TaxID=137732 RepID=UPI000A6AFFD3|nr:MFS transporter [Granulicatella elegans]UEA31477.1 MFS transporter [Granulicatella elegans]